MLAEIVNEREADVTPDDLPVGGDVADSQVLRAFLGDAAAEHAFDGKAVVGVREDDDAAIVHAAQCVVYGALHEARETLRRKDRLESSVGFFAQKQ